MEYVPTGQRKFIKRSSWNKATCSSFSIITFYLDFYEKKTNYTRQLINRKSFFLQLPHKFRQNPWIFLSIFFEAILGSVLKVSNRKHHAFIFNPSWLRAIYMVHSESLHTKWMIPLKSNCSYLRAVVFDKWLHLQAIVFT